MSSYPGSLAVSPTASRSSNLSVLTDSRPSSGQKMSMDSLSVLRIPGFLSMLDSLLPSFGESGPMVGQSAMFCFTKYLGLSRNNQKSDAK